MRSTIDWAWGAGTEWTWWTVLLMLNTEIGFLTNSPTNFLLIPASIKSLYSLGNYRPEEVMESKEDWIHPFTQCSSLKMEVFLLVEIAVLLFSCGMLGKWLSAEICLVQLYSSILTKLDASHWARTRVTYLLVAPIPTRSTSTISWRNWTVLIYLIMI